MHCNISAKRKTPLRRSLRNPIRCLDQAAASAVAFLRFLRRESRPNAPRPVAKSGSAAGSGVAAVNSVKSVVPKVSESESDPTFSSLQTPEAHAEVDRQIANPPREQSSSVSIRNQRDL
jgi:hypothetical protein